MRHSHTCIINCVMISHMPIYTYPSRGSSEGGARAPSHFIDPNGGTCSNYVTIYQYKYILLEQSNIQNTLIEQSSNSGSSALSLNVNFSCPYTLHITLYLILCIHCDVQTNGYTICYFYTWICRVAATLKCNDCSETPHTCLHFLPT